MTEKELTTSENYERFIREVPRGHPGGDLRPAAKHNWMRKPGSGTREAIAQRSSGEIMRLLTDDWMTVKQINELWRATNSSHSVAGMLIVLLASRQIEGAFVAGSPRYRRKQPCSTATT